MVSGYRGTPRNEFIPGDNSVPHLQFICGSEGKIVYKRYLDRAGSDFYANDHKIPIYQGAHLRRGALPFHVEEGAAR